MLRFTAQHTFAVRYQFAAVQLVVGASSLTKQMIQLLAQDAGTMLMSTNLENFGLLLQTEVDPFETGVNVLLIQFKDLVVRNDT